MKLNTYQLYPLQTSSSNCRVCRVEVELRLINFGLSYLSIRQRYVSNNS
ncbi:Bgt-20452 [Blumeria graminis f. sp. tritici]|uniref:Bgt-20452 n=2 Tax=Blumeria graminis f. sp. tritici TaxID=62690 RepID=A0A9X9QBZ0_BLUGR|nr:Bgt-20452 [Blumeria graminis f. sp. tritici]